ncbi:MAG: hypothetical protein ABL880_02390 [Methylotenera sp.]
MLILIGWILRLAQNDDVEVRGGKLHALQPNIHAVARALFSVK